MWPPELNNRNEAASSGPLPMTTATRSLRPTPSAIQLTNHLSRRTRMSLYRKESARRSRGPLLRISPGDLRQKVWYRVRDQIAHQLLVVCIPSRRPGQTGSGSFASATKGVGRSPRESTTRQEAESRQWNRCSGNFDEHSSAIAAAFAGNRLVHGLRPCSLSRERDPASLTAFDLDCHRIGFLVCTRWIRPTFDDVPPGWHVAKHDLVAGVDVAGASPCSDGVATFGGDLDDVSFGALFASEIDRNLILADLTIVSATSFAGILIG